MRLFAVSLVLVAATLPAAAQVKSYEIRKPTGTWQVPGEIQKPRDVWQTPGEIQKPRAVWQQPGEIQKPREVWQQPGEIQAPQAIEAPQVIQVPQAVEVPQVIEAPPRIQVVRSVAISRCERRLSVIADALFDFDKSSLRAEAEEALLSAAPEIRELGGNPASIEGHTDAKGGDAYNIRLSEARATVVRDWMAQQSLIPAQTPIKGYGKTRPAAPNMTEDGKDDPEGRQKNRRVEIVFDTCK